MNAASENDVVTERAPTENAPAGPRVGPVMAWARAIGVFRGFLLVSLIPVSVGAATAYQNSAALDLGWLAITAFAVWCFHAGANLLNDYYDHVSGTDDINEVRTPFSGGTRVIQDGLIGAAAIRNAGIAAYAVGCGVFAWLGHERGAAVWGLAFFGLLSGVFYTMRPIWLAYRGLGELMVGLNFGPALTALGCYVQMGSVPVSAWVLGLTLGLWSAAIITINEIPDVEADEKVGKRNLVVRFGEDAGVRLWLVLLWLTAAVLFAGVLMGFLPRRMVVALLIVFPIFFVTRDPEVRTEFLEDIVAACRNTVLAYIGYWILLLAALFYASRGN